MSRITLVGNAPLQEDRSSLIDGSDFVVRFNQPHSYGGYGGIRFDAWVLANGKGASKFARNHTFIDAPYRDVPKRIWLPREMEVHRALRRGAPDEPLKPGNEIDYSDEILRENRLQQPCDRISADVYWRSISALRKFSPALDKMPSSGFVTLIYVLERFPEWQVTLVGFSFEGWSGHPWELERRFVQAAAERGVMDLV
jgi:hypothetical protein